MDRIPITEVAILVRKALKPAFPDCKFGVRSQKYAGGSTIHVSWDNGPTTTSCEKVAGHFHGADFDGMEDLKTYNSQPYGNDYIFFNRTITQEHYLEEAKSLVAKYGLIVSPEELDATDAEVLAKTGRWTLRQAAWQILTEKAL
ncbi:hypothetical protein LCGC14_1019030 [marine sediment metagenome]|uniref:Large polyvalent protein associated domain-containing protein n=1 Tax=marine sediment metagenome TaxID=412755 RepID=A0A0F9MXX8_9ZZZZ